MMPGATQGSVNVTSIQTFDYSHLFANQNATAGGAITVGVLSDSHIPFRQATMPTKVSEWFSDCNLILHAGDLEDPDILVALRALAPTHAVAGNIHWTYASGTHDLDMPRQLSIIAGSHHIWMTHGHWNFRHTFIDKVNVATRFGVGKLGLPVRGRTLQMANIDIVNRLANYKPGTASVVIFGHTHARLALVRAGTLYFNPGAVVGAEGGLAPRSIGKLHLFPDGRMDHEWTDLP